MVQNDREVLEACFEYFLKTFNITVEAKGGLGTMAFLSGVPLIDTFGSSVCNVQDWMRKIKNIFDSENLSVHSAYVSPEPVSLEPPQKI